MTDCLVAKARVLATYANSRIAVELVGSQACPGCRCGRLALVTPGPRGPLVLDARMRVRTGDEILVRMPAATVLRGALWLHGVPLLGLLAGGAAGATVSGGDLGCFLGALTGLTAALASLRLRPCTRSVSAADLTIAPTV